MSSGKWKFGGLLAIIAAVAFGMGFVYPSLFGNVGVCNPLFYQQCIAVDASGNVPITGSITAVPGVLVVVPTDKGSTIAAGGTAQTAIAANASRKGCWIQNPFSATEDLYVSTTGAAVAAGGTPNDADLGPGGTFSCLQGGNIIQLAVSVNATTTGHAFIGKETQ